MSFRFELPWLLSTLEAEDAQLPTPHPAVFDFCFVDGDHSFVGAARDYRTYSPLCRRMMFHDIGDARVYRARAGHGSTGFWVWMLNHTAPERIRQFS